MRWLPLAFVWMLVAAAANGQSDTMETSRIMRILAGDSLKGRGNLQPSLLHAARFIAGEFEAYGLQPLPGFPSYYIPFHPRGWNRRRPADVLTWNGRRVPTANVLFLRRQPGMYRSLSLGDFEIMRLDTALTPDVLTFPSDDPRPLLIWSPVPWKKKQPLPTEFVFPDGGLRRDVLLVVSPQPPTSLTIAPNRKYYNEVAYNVAAWLPSTSGNEDLYYITAHYDHEGVKPVSKGEDSIFNGANDNASGTTAMLRLAHRFAAAGERGTGLYFIAFAGEEMGLLGSEALAPHLPLRRTRGVVNLEMLGVTQFGTKTLMIPERERTTFGRQLTELFKQEGLTIVNDRDPERLLFERSDNYSFFRRGVPAHIIMGSDDDDPCYHKACDELARIDMLNLSELIIRIGNAIAALK